MKTLKMNNEGSKEGHVFTTVLHKAMQNIEKLASKKDTKEKNSETKTKKSTKNGNYTLTS